MPKRGRDNKNGTVRFPDDNLSFQIDDMMTGDERRDKRRMMVSPNSMNLEKPLPWQYQLPGNAENLYTPSLHRTKANQLRYKIRNGISAKTEEEQEILHRKRMQNLSNFIDNPVTRFSRFIRSPASAVDNFFDGRVNAEVARKKKKAKRENNIMGGASRKTRKKRKTRKQKLEKRKQTKNSHYIQ